MTNQVFVGIHIDSLSRLVIEPYRGYPREKVLIRLPSIDGDVEISIDPSVAKDVARKIVDVANELKAPPSRIAKAGA